MKLYRQRDFLIKSVASLRLNDICRVLGKKNENQKKKEKGRSWSPIVRRRTENKTDIRKQK